MVCSTFILAAIGDITDKVIRLEGKDTFLSDSDLEKTPPTAPGKPWTGPDADALIDPLTRDGLYYYTEAERLDAAKKPLQGHL
jgi:hypothetical protein